MYGLTRATTTLLAAAAGGLLIWFATQTNDQHLGGFWAAYGLIAGAGLLMALSQLLGGWTKWGWPRLSATFLLTAFVPITIVSLWIILVACCNSVTYNATRQILPPLCYKAKMTAR